LTSGVSPYIPTATQNYEPLVKGVLRYRLLCNIFLYSAIFSSIQTVIWRTWCHGFSALGPGQALFIPILPTTLALAGMNWAVACLPLIILRKVYLTGELLPFLHCACCLDRRIEPQQLN
jgi:nucleoporin NDC1